MSTVYTGASMSLDGYISGPGESGFEHLFQWYGNGEVEVPTGDPNMTLRMTDVSADHWRATLELTGSLVVGRKLFDAMGGWGGKHPADKPVVVLTHREAPEGWDDKPFTFVTGGIEQAIAVASDLAGHKGVGLNGGTIASQALDAGLLDEVWVDLVPVLLGGGTPFFSALGTVPVALEGPISVTEGTNVTHMRYRVRR
ncbi:MAG TPA: deaminase [Solirubrobacteraceae bacterium]|nr:deaminase [Solirubrobacteraceae bacterium]